MIKLFIIADDFTGALDTAVQFSKNGVRAMATTNTHIDLAELEEDIEVLALNTETRHCDAAGAYERVHAAVTGALKQGVTHFYKKTDSTLRGNIGAELQALLDATGSGCVDFIPAFPRMGRVTVNGRQLIDGVPLDETAYAQDPFDPVHSSSVARIIAAQTSTPVRPVSREGRMPPEPGGWPAIYLHDAASQQDLRDIGGALRAAGRLQILAGCAGFAEVLLELLEFRRRPPLPRPVSRSVLVVCGSVSQVSIDQAGHARSKGIPGYVLTCRQRLDVSYGQSRESEELVGAVAAAIERDGVCLLQAVDDRRSLADADDYARAHNIEAEQMHLLIAENIGFLVQLIAARTRMDTIVVFGGDTLMGIVNNLGGGGIAPRQEIMAGVVLSDLVAGDARRLQIISKSGSFGERDVVLRILAKITS